MQRRHFLTATLAAAAGSWPHTESWQDRRESVFQPQPAFSVIPVVGDGKWIWKEPPQDQTGYLEPRRYRVEVGIELEGIGNSQRVISTTTAPTEFPEQQIESVEVEAEGCQAALRELAPGAGQLILAVPALAKGQIARAVAHYQVTLSKQYQAYEQDQFPADQNPPAEVRQGYLQDSPGIQTRDTKVRKLARELTEDCKHPWEMARAFAQWIPRHIHPQIGSYTSVTAAVRDRRGDCEEMAGLFVALCRVMQIPARLVWVPNHAWAEFYLVDHDGAGHWIPAHTACYFWFGWNGAHELVLQKGDRVEVPERRDRFRLLEDWIQYVGRKPRVTYTGRVVPEPPTEGEDAGPGAREKTATGEWKVTGDHPLDRYIRR